MLWLWCPIDGAAGARLAAGSGLSVAHSPGDKERRKAGLVERMGDRKAVDDLVDQAIGNRQLVLVGDERLFADLAQHVIKKSPLIVIHRHHCQHVCFDAFDGDLDNGRICRNVIH